MSRVSELIKMKSILYQALNIMRSKVVVDANTKSDIISKNTIQLHISSHCLESPLIFK